MSFGDFFQHVVYTILAKKKVYFILLAFISIFMFTFVLAMQSGNLFEALVAKNFNLLGERVLKINSATASNDDRSLLTLADVKFFKEEGHQDIESVHGFVGRNGTVRANNYSMPCVIKGITGDYREFYPMSLYPNGGKFIDDGDLAGENPIAVVSNVFAEKYFKRFDILGQTIELKNNQEQMERFTIVGVLWHDGAVVGGSEGISEIYIPASTALKFLNMKSLDFIEIKIVKNADLETVGERSRKFLQKEHGEGADFVVRQRMDVQLSKGEVSKSFGFIVAAMGVLSILLGLLGISATMRSIVGRRAHEIAVRKLMGATDRDIYLHFVGETLIITIFGGVAGILLSVMFGSVLTFVFKYENLISPDSIIFGVVAMILTGSFAGLWPAADAVKVDISGNIKRE